MPDRLEGPLVFCIILSPFLVACFFILREAQRSRRRTREIKARTEQLRRRGF